MSQNRVPIGPDIHTSGHSQRLRSVLRTARKEQGIKAVEVCRRIGVILTEYARVRDPSAFDVDPPHTNTLYSWERFDRHPGIDSMAAWARALGYRLLVDLDDATHPRHHVLLDHAESVQLARIVDALPSDERAALLKLLSR